MEKEQQEKREQKQKDVFNQVRNLPHIASYVEEKNEILQRKELLYHRMILPNRQRHHMLLRNERQHYMILRKDKRYSLVKQTEI